MARALVCVMPATCGVSSRFGQTRSGWPEGSGCTSNTSSAAPASAPACRAAASAAVSTTGPRATLMSTAPGRIRPISPASTRPRVASVSGQAITTASLCAHRVSRSTASTRPPSVAPLREAASTRMPKPWWAIRATRPPISPRPSTPRVLPPISPRPSAIGRTVPHPAVRSPPSRRQTWRRRWNRAAKTYSATACVLLPGRLATGMPRAVAAATGIMSRPTPWRTMPRRRGAPSRMSSGSLTRTTRPSASATSARRVSGLGSGAVTGRAWTASIASASGWIGLVNRTTGRSLMDLPPRRPG